MNIIVFAHKVLEIHSCFGFYRKTTTPFYAETPSFIVRSEFTSLIDTSNIILFLFNTAIKQILTKKNQNNKSKKD